MKKWEKHYRDDKGVWELICEHGVGHEMGIHGCDGCCADKSFKKLYPKKVEPTPTSPCKCHCHQGSKFFHTHYTLKPKHFKTAFCAACKRGETCIHCQPTEKPSITIRGKSPFTAGSGSTTEKPMEEDIPDLRAYGKVYGKEKPMEWEEEFDKEFKEQLVSVFIWQRVKFFIKDLLKEELNKKYWETVEELEEDKEVAEAEEAHRTEAGWCCACGYDMAVLEEKIAEYKQKLIKRIGKMKKEEKGQVRATIIANVPMGLVSKEVGIFNQALDEVEAVIKEV